MVGTTIFGTINDADAQRARNSQTASINQQQTATSSGDQTGLVNVGNVQVPSSTRCSSTSTVCSRRLLI